MEIHCEFFVLYLMTEKSANIIPFSAFEPPTMRACFTLVSPQPSSGVSKRPVVLPSPGWKERREKMSSVQSIEVC